MKRIRSTAIALLGVSLLGAPNAVDAAFPGRNGRIVFNRGSDQSPQIVSANSRGGAVRVLSEGQRDRYPLWSPDGTQIVFTRGGRKNNGIFIMDADGRNVRGAPGRTPREEALPSWSPNGKRILFSMAEKGVYNLYKQRLDGTHRVKLAEDAFQASWSPTGRLIAFTRGVGPDYEVFTMHPDGTHVKRITDNKEYDFSPVWSPDGKHLLVSTFSARNRGDIWRLAPDGSKAKQLTDSRATEASPAWSPNGRLIVYERAPFGSEEDSDLWVMTSSGRFVRRLVTGPRNERFPDWQPQP